MSKFIIGFKGEAGAGKDMHADAVKLVIQERYPFKDIVDCRFADGVKKFVSKMTDVKPELLNDQKFKESYCEKYDCTYRELLIVIGEGFRAIDINHWVKYTFGEMDTDSIYLIRDLRSDVEVDAVHKMGGKVVHIIPRYVNFVPMEHANTPLETQARASYDEDLVILNTSFYQIGCNSIKIVNEFHTEIYSV